MCGVEEGIIDIYIYKQRKGRVGVVGDSLGLFLDCERFLNETFRIQMEYIKSDYAK